MLISFKNNGLNIEFKKKVLGLIPISSMLLLNPKNGLRSLLTEFDATSIRGKGRVLSCI